MVSKLNKKSEKTPPEKKLFFGNEPFFAGLVEIMVTEDGFIHSLSEWTKQELGLRIGDPVGKFLSHISKSERSLVSDLLTRATFKNRSAFFQTIIHCDNGTVQILEAVVSRETAPTGEKLLRFLAFDISSHRQMNESYKEILYESPIAQCVFQKGVVVFINYEFSNNLGYSNPNFLIGKSISNFIRDEDQEWVEETTKLRLEGYGVDAPFSIKLIAKDGETVPFYLLNKRIEWNGEYAIHSTLVTSAMSIPSLLEDISSPILQNFFTLSPDLICICNFKTGAILQANPEFLKTYGYDPKDLKGKSPLEVGIISQSTFDSFQKEFNHKESSAEFEFWTTTKTGLTLP